MRIIDKNTDFYDFYQGIYRDGSITFDRTDSFLLTKELMCEHLSRGSIKYFRGYELYRFVLLQVCNTFWLFVVEITKYEEENGFFHVRDYTVELITTWKNYRKARQLISLDIIRFSRSVDSVLRDKWFWAEYDKTKLYQKADVLINAIDTGDFNIQYSIDRHKIFIGGDKQEEKHIPLLKACGIASCIDPLEIYLAFEEYFSLEKSSRERTASIGITDEEKITNHGFDVKTSFRGKQK